MSIKLNSPSLAVHNKFKLQLYDAEGNLLQEAEAYNTASARKYTMCGIANRFPGGASFSYGLSRVNLGTGTGTIDIDAQDYLFKYAFGRDSLTWKRISNYTFTDMHYRASATFPATTSYVAELTEIGLGPYDSRMLMSHALLVDSEGNPITISKTSTNILIVTIDIFITAKLNKQPFNFLYYPAWASNLAGTGQNTTHLHSTRSLSLPGTGGRIFMYSPQYCPDESSNGIASTCVAYSTYNRKYTASVTTAAGTQFPCTYKSLNNRTDATEYNFGFAHSVVFPGFGIIPLPNADICPEYNYNGISIGTGDGTTKVFLPAINEVVSAKVYVDGKQVEATFQNLDPRKSPLWNKCIKLEFRDRNGTVVATESVPSCSHSGVQTEVTHIPMSSAVAGMVSAAGTGQDYSPCVYTSQSDYTSFSLGTSPVYYDEAGITLDHIRIGKFLGVSYGTWSISTATYYLSYSDDGITWTQAVSINTAYTTVYFTAVTAKYWRLHGGPSGGSWTIKGYLTHSAQEDSNKSKVDFDPKYIVAGNSAEFDFGKCGINFVDAPADGASITMDAVLNLPYKDTNTIFICSYEAEVPDPGEAT